MENPQVKHCEEYGDLENQKACTRCHHDYFMVHNECQLRTASSDINFCEMLDARSEVCVQCQAHHIISDDSLKCFKVIDNCVKYYPSTSDQTKILCEQCANGFYINKKENICQRGETENCDTYDDLQFCQKC